MRSGNPVTTSDNSSITLTGAQYEYAYADVTVTDAATGLATTRELQDPNNVSGLVWNTDPSWLPTVTIKETDPGGTVSGGSLAHFGVQAQWSAESWGTSGMGPWLPVVLPMTVYYDTIDPSGSAPADYQSTYGPQPVTLSVSFDSATDTWIANGTIQVQTTSVISDGGQGSVTVEVDRSVFVSACRRRGRRHSAGVSGRRRLGRQRRGHPGHGGGRRAAGATVPDRR